MLDIFSSMGITVVSFLVVLGLLVFVHELGHFAVAKWAGIRVEEFGFGFPPRMVTLFTKGETAYTINWLPLGGFVRMVGENGEEFDDPRSFASKSRLWRAAVLVAGSFMNLILPIFIFTLIALIGVPDGDLTGRVELVRIEPGSPAQEVGLRSGDFVLTLDDEAIRDTDTLTSRIQAADGPIELRVERAGEPLTFTVEPRPAGADQSRQLGIGIVDEREIVRYNPISAVVFGVDQTFTLLALMIGGLADLVGSLFQGTAESGAVTGPLGIMQVTGEIARTGKLINLLNFTAYLSLNLAIINMLPIPALDGGRLLFVLLEALRGGRRISPEREGMVHLVGMLLLLGLMAVVSVVDIQRLIGGGSILQ